MYNQMQAIKILKLSYKNNRLKYLKLKISKNNRPKKIYWDKNSQT
jgi:hypothetical protein